MKFSRIFHSAAVVVATGALISCESPGNVDVKYPTVQQMDALDVQWGLPKRKSRGTPSRSLTFDGGVSAPSAVVPSGVAPLPALPDPALEVKPSPSAPASPATVIPDQLR
jgi:hypothetical protein